MHRSMNIKNLWSVFHCYTVHNVMRLDGFGRQRSNLWHEWTSSSSEALNYVFFFLPMAQEPIVVHGILIIESATPYTLDRTPLDEWSAWRKDLHLKKHTTLTRDRHPCPLRDSYPQSQQASGHGPTPRGHWDRPYILLQTFL